MKKLSKNKFFRIGLLIFIAYLFMNPPFIPKYWIGYNKLNIKYSDMI